MTDILTVSLGATAVAADSAKRRQIIEGARAVFLAQGFDAASMSDIARKAGVSKGTLYVYFKSKEELFEAITEEQCSMQAERVFELDPRRPRCRGGADAARHRVRDLHVQPLDLADPHRDRDRRSHAGSRPPVLRDRPGGRHRQARRAISRAQVEAGVLERSRIAKSPPGSSSNSCLSGTFKPVLFNFAPPPPQERIDHVVGIAVRAFMKAYGKS